MAIQGMTALHLYCPAYIREGPGVQGAGPLQLFPSDRLGELHCVVLDVVLAMMGFDRLALCLGARQRAGGVGRDRPKSRTPGRLADRRARRAAVGGSPLKA